MLDWMETLWKDVDNQRPHVTPIADLSLLCYFLLRLTLHLTFRHNWEGTKKEGGANHLAGGVATHPDSDPL